MSAFSLNCAEHAEIGKAVAEAFPTFGGGRRGNDFNPIAAALADQPAQFAAGVSVEAVVSAVLRAADNVVEKRYRFALQRDDGRDLFWTINRQWKPIVHAKLYTADEAEALKQVPMLGRLVRIDPRTLSEA